MGRPAGRRNADYDDERSALLGRLQVAVLAPGGAALSFRELAAAADVSPATLRHYFQDRPGVLRAALAALGNGGAPYLRAVAEGPLEVGGQQLPSIVHTAASSYLCAASCSPRLPPSPRSLPSRPSNC